MKTRITLLLLTALLLLSFLALPSCSPKAEAYKTHSLDYFDTFTTITGYADSREAFDEVANRVLERLGEYHRLFTIYNRYEGVANLCAVNDLEDGVHPTVKVERPIIDLLLCAKEMHRLTGGRVNVAMGSVLSIWHAYRTEGMNNPAAAKLPPMDQLLEAAEHTSIDCILIDEEASTVTITDPAATLDVGAIAKGFAVELVAEELEAEGITGYVINVGGNVRTVGSKADGTPWLAGIENPSEEEGAEPYFAYLNLSGESLVTSGSYQRYYLVDGKRYHHIIHPDTLMPEDLYLSVSVVCQSSAQGDALSTALFCMTPEEGLALVESLTGVEALWILNSGERQASSGFEARTAEP